MNKSRKNSKLVLMLAIMLTSLFVKLNAQEKGYWQLERIESINKEEVSGNLSRKVTGEAGDLLYTFNGANTTFVVKASWDALPKTLKPGDNVSFPAMLKIEKFVRPQSHFSPVSSMQFVSLSSSGTFEQRKMNAGYCNTSLRVSASTSDAPGKALESERKTVSIRVPASPEQLKGELFIIKVRLGSSLAFREHYYIYKWHKGQAPVVIQEKVQGSAWQLDRIETKNKEQVVGKLSRKVTGEAGDLLYTFNSTNITFVVKASWDALPKTLKPGDNVSFPAMLKIEKFVRPQSHFSPVSSMQFVSLCSSGTFEQRKMNAGYCNTSLRVSASTSDAPGKALESERKTVSIRVPESPEQLKGELFIIKVRMGSSLAFREYYYIYKWHADKTSKTKQ